jgi:hypothetical protein
MFLSCGQEGMMAPAKPRALEGSLKLITSQSRDMVPVPISTPQQRVTVRKLWFFPPELVEASNKSHK